MVGCQVMVKEYLGALNELQHPITNETHKTRTYPDNMPSNRPKKSMYHQAKVIKIVSEELIEIEYNSNLKRYGSRVVLLKNVCS